MGIFALDGASAANGSTNGSWLRGSRGRARSRALVQQGHVRLDGKRVTDGARKLRTGDVLTLALPHATTVVRVRAGAEKRGSFAVAARLTRCSGPDSIPRGFGPRNSAGLGNSRMIPLYVNMLNLAAAPEAFVGCPVVAAEASRQGVRNG